MTHHTTKIGVVVREDLAVWQKLNVTAFLISGIAGVSPDSIGEPYKDASGNVYHALFGQPVLVYSATAEQLQRMRARAKDRDVQLALYSQEMFQTGNDVDNRGTVEKLREEELVIVGLALRAESKVFDKVVAGLKLHS